MAKDSFASEIASQVAATVLGTIRLGTPSGNGADANSTKEPTSPRVVPMLLRVSEAAIVLARTSRAVRHLIDRGQLRVVRHGRAVRIAFDEILDFIARGRTRRAIKLCSSNCKRKRG